MGQIRDQIETELKIFETNKVNKKDRKISQLPAGTFKFLVALIVTEIFQFQSRLKF